MNVRCVNFGCGFDAPDDWINYDASPNLFLQRFLFFKYLPSSFWQVKFPKNVLYGNITHSSFPEKDSSVDLLYSSHTLEHLSLEGVRKALKTAHRVLKKGMVFRGVLPDLEFEVKNYLNNNENDKSINFMIRNDIGKLTDDFFYNTVRQYFGKSKHLSFWDFKTLKTELLSIGFSSVRRAYYNDSAYEEFLKVENINRWDNCLGFEAIK